MCTAAIHAAARAQSLDTAALEQGETGVVIEVVDGDTVRLASGIEVRLVGIQAPKLALGRPGFVDWPLAEDAKAGLADWVLDRPVTLHYGGRRVDRHGRALAHLARDDGLWVQGALLAGGLARVYSFADNRALIADMLALEQDARVARRGIWDHAYYRIRSPEDLDRVENRFELVEGVVADAAVVRGRGYLNFGADWRTDFTVSVAPRDRRLFDRAGRVLTDLIGKRVRVRGWVEQYNGPMIEATHPEQIEVLGE